MCCKQILPRTAKMYLIRFFFAALMTVSYLVSDVQAQSKEGRVTFSELRIVLGEVFGLPPKRLQLDTNLKQDFQIDTAVFMDKMNRVYFRFRIAQPEKQLATIEKILNHLQTAKKASIKKKRRFFSFHDKPSKSREQGVFFATNRKSTKNRDPEHMFSGQPITRKIVKYGLAYVNLPEVRKRGTIPRPLFGLRSLRTDRKHMFVKRLKMFDSRDLFMTNIGSHNRVPLMLYVHGFNNTFGESVIRAAQVVEDFQFPGLPVVFSWPSNGSALSYSADLSDAESSVPAFMSFIKELNRRFDEREIHLVAHSMGANLVIKTLQRLSDQGVKGPVFKSVILAAPDVNTHIFNAESAKYLEPLAQHWAVYTSQRDYTLLVSGWYNDTPRLGNTPLPLQGMQMIDASTIEVTPWNVSEVHSYFAIKKRIVDDMKGVISGISPQVRGLIKQPTGQAAIWLLSVDK